MLARILEHDGSTVVLDFGEPAVIRQAMEKVVHGGFVVLWEGKRRQAQPGSPDFIRQLALHYASLGHLVEVAEFP
ncbi:MAG: hypothetical protein AAGA48_35930 [Myxococcota bacterium]